MRIKFMVGALTLGCAIAISAVAAYFSVVGLAALFAAAFIPVCIMGTFLETSKLVAAGWLHSNWKNSHVSKLHKGYLVAAILTLMTVTSMGIYGYLMKAHLEQNAPTAAIQVDLDQKQARLDQLTAQRDQLLTQEKAINQTVTSYLGSGKASGAGRFMNQQKATEEELQTKINAVNDQITQANVDMAPLKKKVAASGVELGQWKYLAKALGLKDPDAAIDILVKMLMFAFDPMAVVLMISGTITLGEWARERREHVPEKTVLETLAPEVDEDDPEIDPYAEFAERTRGTLPDLKVEDFDMSEPVPEAEPVLLETPEPEFMVEAKPGLMEFDPHKLLGIQKMTAPTGQIFQMRLPDMKVEPASFDFYSKPVEEEEDHFVDTLLAARGTIPADVDMPLPETQIEDFGGVPPVEGRGTLVEHLPTGEELEEFRNTEWGRYFQDAVAKMKEGRPPANYLDWSNAVQEAHTVDPEVEPTEAREPEPDLAPEADHGEVALVIQTDEDDIEWLEPEPAEPISLEEAFEREMANEDVRLEEDINRVGDRDILLALLESNPTLLEELVQAVEESKAGAQTQDLPVEPVDENSPKTPVHWFEAKNPSHHRR